MDPTDQDKNTNKDLNNLIQLNLNITLFILIFVIKTLDIFRMDPHQKIKARTKHNKHSCRRTQEEPEKLNSVAL